MQVFVSGATGFIGRHLVRALVTQGWDVVALIRHPGRARVLPEGGVTLVRGTLEDEQVLHEALSGIAVVLHLGAAMAGAWPVHQQITVEGTRRLQNMLLERSRIGPGPRAVGRGARVVGSGLGMLAQTARNTLRFAVGRALPPGSPLHLIRAHYAALAAGREPPGQLSRARKIVGITRAIWPMPALRTGPPTIAPRASGREPAGARR